jgi:hypothetical protein
MFDNALVLIWIRNMRRRETCRRPSPRAERVSSEYVNHDAIWSARPSTRKNGSTLVSSWAASRKPGISGRTKM